MTRAFVACILVAGVVAGPVPGPLFAQETAQAPTIDRIEVANNQFLQRETLLFYISTKPGERFPNLALRDPRNKEFTLSSERGKVIILHFWGSWCAPCRKEMPDLAALRDALKADKRIAFVLTQVREPFARSRAWMTEQKLSLPLYDSGVRGDADGMLSLAGGGRLADREVATVFPSTYVLDRHGIVLLAHFGPVPRWSEYAPFLRDAAARSGN